MRGFRHSGRSVHMALSMMIFLLSSDTLRGGGNVSTAFSPPFGCSSSSYRRNIFHSASTTVAAIGSRSSSSLSSTASTTAAAPVTKSTGNKRLAAGTAALTGWADVVLNIKLGTFCTMMTGNTMWLAKAFTDFHWSNGLYYASVISSYLVGLAFYRTWQNQATSTSSEVSSSQESTKTRFLVKIGASVVVLFALADVFFDTYSPVTSLVLHKWVPASLLAAAFALVNGVGIDTAGTMTFVVTGHMTKFIHTLVDTPYTQWTNLLRTNGGIHMNLSVVTGFFLGALWGNILRHLGLLSANFTYMGILLGLLFLWKDSILQRVEGGGGSTMSSRWYTKMRVLPRLSKKQEVVLLDHHSIGTSSAAQDTLDGIVATDMDSGSRGNLAV